MPFLERTDATNWSSLKHMRVSPKHYLWALEHPRADSDALLLGRVTHALVYEPAEFAGRYTVEPNFHGGMNDDTARAKGYDGGKQAKAAWLAANADVEVVPSELYERARGMRTALLADPVAGGMVSGGVAEVPITWTDALTGIECRGRIDHINGRLSDLKTTRCIEPRIFGHDLVRLGYHAQLAWYADGLEASGHVLAEPPCLIVVENEPPHDVVVMEFTKRDLAAGRAVYRGCLDKLAECRFLGRFPGVSGGERQYVDLPKWALPEWAMQEDAEPAESLI